jgi:hypothetical protein
MAEIQRRFYAAIYGNNAVQLSPEVGSETYPNDLGITQINIVTSATTPPTSFWNASGSCGRYNVIIQKIS